MGGGRRLMRGASETLSGLSCFTSYYEQNTFVVVFFVVNDTLSNSCL